MLSKERIEIDAILALIPVRIITWKAYWALAPFSVLSVCVFVQQEFTTESAFLSWLAIGFLSHASMAPFVIYAHGKFARRTHFILSACMGAARGASIGLLAPILLVQDPISLISRTFNSSLTVFYALIITGIIFSVWAGFERDLRTLLSDAINDRKIEPSLTSLSPTGPQHDSNIQELLSKLSFSLSQAKEEGGSVYTLTEQANAIDKLIKDHIRPHSAKRWRESELIWPKIQIQNVLYRSLVRTPAPVISVLILMLPLSLTGHIAREGFLHGCIGQVLGFTLTIAMLLLSRLVTRRFSQTVATSNLLFMVFFIFLQAPILVALGWMWPTTNAYSSVSTVQVSYATMLTFIALIGIAAITLTVRSTRNDALNLLRDSISTQAMERMISGSVASTSKSDYAQYLHAEVQSQLLACKLLLLKAAESDFQLFSPEVTQKVVKRIELLNTPFERRPIRIPAERLKEMAATWKGLARIHFDFPTEFEKISSNGEVISQLIEESIVNAIRHGKAKNIRVTATIESGTCFMKIQDDGKFKSTKSQGLGSTLFEVFAPDWKLTTNEIGTLATLSAKFY